MRAQIDEIYITRVEAGQTAEFDLEGQTWTMAVTPQFFPPEVIDGTVPGGAGILPEQRLHRSVAGKPFVYGLAIQ